MYADTFAAFNALPADVRDRIMGRRACFSRARFHEVYYPHLGPLTEAQKKARPDVWHPIARHHPHSGWTSLYIGRWAYRIDGMPDDEAQELIDYLKDFATRPEFVYRHKWRVGDALLWDNRCTQHCATAWDDSKYTRRMQRTTLEGEVPIMAERAVLRPAEIGSDPTFALRTDSENAASLRGAAEVGSDPTFAAAPCNFPATRTATRPRPPRTSRRVPSLAISAHAALAAARGRDAPRATRRDRAPAAPFPRSASPSVGAVAGKPRALGTHRDVHGGARRDVRGHVDREHRPGRQAHAAARGDLSGEQVHAADELGDEARRRRFVDRRRGRRSARCGPRSSPRCGRTSRAPRPGRA